ncbi:MAG: SDR family oxidoreductase [Pseudomonadota bacterium]|nr:SDR family oxidoreductase [Pseudomonadota bacterium]
MGTVLIVGASRGIGLEFVRQYTAEGHRVIATHRTDAAGETLRALGAKPAVLNLLDEGAVVEFGEKMAAEKKIDVAVLNAGVAGPRGQAIRAPGGLDFDAVMHTNVRAPMQLIPALSPALIAAGGKLAVLSSRMGSVSSMSNTASWLYRASKAALNAALKTASIELGPQGVVCIAFHPGWVRTDMGGGSADIDVHASVAGMRRILAAANDSSNGKFINYNGEQLSW